MYFDQIIREQEEIPKTKWKYIVNKTLKMFRIENPVQIAETRDEWVWLPSKNNVSEGEKAEAGT